MKMGEAADRSSFTARLQNGRAFLLLNNVIT